jgi:ATP-dependent exoDNAse (exonuclease V) beta subunit
LSELDLIIVDEFQDSNPAQLKMIQQLMNRSPQAKLLMIGDYDQNIYLWRGAKYKLVQGFIDKYSD